ncbi:uncharacterized protein TNCV_1363261 [Trichonephila clavipes]|uniref:Mutator-like transposase domain-containing protein n=1 Tax=Trichonephila clavipes TaxID=2585209 RepID=A0A8X6VCB5_TRICX|nr:uncharacterized protein TNCV_1363261 [Trichonephila clavipes]
MSLPNPVEQKSYDVINNKLSRVMKEVAEESMKRAAVEENSSSPDNLLTVSGDGTWKTRGHSSLIGVCTVIGAETGKVLDREVLSSFCKGCDSYKGVKFGIKYNKWQRAHKLSCRKNYSGSAGKMEVDGMLRIFNRSEKLHNLKYSNYIGDGDTKTFNALSENKPYGDDHLIQKIECVGHVQKRMGRLTDSLIDKLAHYYGNAIRCNSTSVKEMRKAIWAVWGHSCSTDDEPMHWFCPTNPNTWCKYNAAINNNLQNYKHKPSVAKAVRDVIKSVFADLSHPALLKKCLGEKFGLKINRNVCVSLAERDNRRIFTSRQRCLQSSFEARRAKKIKKSKEIELFQEQEGHLMGRALDWYQIFGSTLVQNTATDFAQLKAALSKAPAIQNKKELETRFYASQQRENQEPTDFVYDLLKLHKKLELGMSEKALVDHIFVRLEPCPRLCGGA